MRRQLTEIMKLLGRGGQPKWSAPTFTSREWLARGGWLMSSRRDAEFTDFVAVRLPALRRVAFLLCQDWHQADDLVQVAITRLYANWRRAAVMDHTEAYVRTILVREYLSERRSGWARRVSLDAVVPELAAVQPDRDVGLDINAALAGLPPRQRATIVLR